jgi:curved DNA-binding protein CbpA
VKARDPYAVLGVPRNATVAEIKAVYRQLAKTFHPDVNAGRDAEERFKRITEAFLALCDPERRASLDAASAKRGSRRQNRRSRGEVTDIDVGLRVAGIDLGCLVGAHVTVTRRPLFEDEVAVPDGPAGLLPEPR